MCDLAFLEMLDMCVPPILKLLNSILYFLKLLIGRAFGRVGVRVCVCVCARGCVGRRAGGGGTPFHSRVMRSDSP